MTAMDGPVSLLKIVRRSWRDVIFETYRSWQSHRTIRLGAGLAYYGLFAIVPLLSICVVIAGLVLDPESIQDTLSRVLGDIVDGDGESVAVAITESIDRSSILTSLGLIGLGSLILASSLVFVALQDAFDTIWEIPYRSGARNSVRRRLVAFTVALLSGAVLVASFAVNALAGVVRELAPGQALLLETLADVLAVAGSWALSAVVFAALFRYLTSARVRWSLALIGGTATAATLTIGNRLVAEYLQRYGASSLAGAAGSILVGLFWIYSVAQIVLAGAELTRVLDILVGPQLDGDSDTDTEPRRDVVE